MAGNAFVVAVFQHVDLPNFGGTASISDRLNYQGKTEYNNHDQQPGYQ